MGIKTMVEFSETALYHTFSNIAQTLAGLFALLAAFVLYRLSILNDEMGWNGAVLAEGIKTDEVRTLNGEGRYQELLDLAARSNNAGRPTEFKAEVARSVPQMVIVLVRFLGLNHCSRDLCLGLFHPVCAEAAENRFHRLGCLAGHCRVRHLCRELCDIDLEVTPIHPAKTAGVTAAATRERRTRR
jgi:hypothetical protein